MGKRLCGRRNVLTIMLNISANVIRGSGTAPKNVGLGDVVLLDATSNDGTTFEWDILSRPNGSNVMVDAPMGRAVRLGPIDVYGVYLAKLIVDRDLPRPQTKLVSITVPQSISPNYPPEPLFTQGGSIRNFAFSLPGTNAGEALYWETVDENNILEIQGGITRGLIIPQNFVPPVGTHAMCLGDDQQIHAFFGIDTEFSITQEVDFSRATVLTIEIKFEPPVP